MFSLTTKLSARDLIAVRQLANTNGMTESAWLRDLIRNQVDVHTEPVQEELIQELLLNGRNRRPRKSAKSLPWKVVNWFKSTLKLEI